MMWEMLAVISMQMLCFYVFKCYAGVLRFSTHLDLVKLLFSQLLCLFVLLWAEKMREVLQLGDGARHYSEIIYCSVSFILLSVERITVRVMFDAFYRRKHSEPLMILGTREENLKAKLMLQTDVEQHYRVVAFVEDNVKSDEQLLLGVTLLPLKEAVVHDFIIKHSIKNVLVTSTHYLHTDSNDVVKSLTDWGMTLMQMPNTQLMDYKPGEKKPLHLERIKIDDLLNREPIHMDDTPIRKWVSGKVVLVTGAAGSIGSELVRQLANYEPSQLVLIDNAETPLHAMRVEMSQHAKHPNCVTIVADVRSRERMLQLMNQYKPSVVYHAAAYKHVPMMEDNPSEAILDNVHGTRCIADSCLACGVERMVMISTDKAVNPSNVMGASKRIAEIYVQSLDEAVKQGLVAGKTHFITTRFGNVLGSNGSVIPFFKKQIEEGGPVTVTHPDIIRYFMTIPEACQLVLQAGTMGQGGEIYIFDMGKPVKIVDLAARMIRLAGYTPGKDIQIVFTGLRPGEKLYEELLNVKETTIPTYNEKIHIAKVREYNYADVLASVNAMVKQATSYDQDKVVQQMKRLVPEFVSQNSDYSKFDRLNIMAEAMSQRDA